MYFYSSKDVYFCLLCELYILNNCHITIQFTKIFYFEYDPNDICYHCLKTFSKGTSANTVCVCVRAHACMRGALLDADKPAGGPN